MGRNAENNFGVVEFWHDGGSLGGKIEIINQTENGKMGTVERMVEGDCEGVW